MSQCGGGTIASVADSHTGASNADLIALETTQKGEYYVSNFEEGTMPISHRSPDAVYNAV